MANFIATNPNPTIETNDIPPIQQTPIAPTTPATSVQPAPATGTTPPAPGTPAQGATNGPYGSFFGGSSGTSGDSSGSGMDPNNFSSLLGQIGTTLQSNNTLVTQKQLLVKSLYDQSLTPDELKQLPPTMQNIVAQGPDAVALQIRVLNDQLQGRNSTLSQSISTLTTGYEDAQTNTQNAMTSILNYAKSTGQPIEAIAKALAPIYGVSVTTKMLNNLKTLGSTLLLNTQSGTTLPSDNTGTDVGGYDLGATTTLGAYATDPNQPQQVREINDQLASTYGTISDPQTAQSAISSIAPNSPVTGEMVMAAAQQYGVDPGVLISVMANDSQLGTQGVGASTFNPGNVGNTGTATNPYNTWQDGVNAVAQNLSERNTQTAQPSVPTPPDTSTPAAQAAANTPDPTTGLSPESLYQDAEEFMFTKSFPNFGLSGTGQIKAAKLAVNNMASALTSAMGTNFPALQALYKANSSAATQTVQRLARVTAVANAVTLQFPRLGSLADQVKAEGITLTESDIQAGSAAAQAKFGSVAAANYIELLTNIRGDYASAIAALAGSRGGEFFATSATEAIPLGYTSSQYQGLQQTILTSTQNATQAMNDEVSSLIGTSGSDGSPNTSGSTPGTSAPAVASGTTGTITVNGKNVTVTMGSDGTITDSSGNKYDSDGNPIQ